MIRAYRRLALVLLPLVLAGVSVGAPRPRAGDTGGTAQGEPRRTTDAVTPGRVTGLASWSGVPGLAPSPTSSTTAPGAVVSPSPSKDGGDRPRRTFTLLAAGDVLLHNAFWAQGASAARGAGHAGYDFAPLFASVRPDVSAADLAICHLETPVGLPDGPWSSYPVFNVPPQVVKAVVSAGFDRCDTASNHSLDQGEQGIDRTLAALDAAGLGHTGSARTPAEATRVTPFPVRGVRVSHLAYTYGLNGMPVPPGRSWLVNRIDVPRILADAHRARQAGAEVVVVSLHWGTEYRHDPDPSQIAQAKALLASPDVDLLLGCHAHVVQPMESLHGKWVVYGMGNEVAWQNRATDTHDGLMVSFTFRETSPGHFRAVTVRAIPTFMRLDGGPAQLLDIPRLLRADVHGALLEQLRASWARTRATVLSRGGAAAGLVVVGPGR